MVSARPAGEEALDRELLHEDRGGTLDALRLLRRSAFGATGNDGAGCWGSGARGTSACLGRTGAVLLKSVTRTLINSLLEATRCMMTCLFSALGIMSDAPTDT